MSTEEEFELTFLASRLPSEIKNKDAVEYSDIYIPEDADFPVLRLRKKGENFELTKKVPIVEGDYSKHVEDTIVLSKSEFQSLKKSSNRKVEKLRYSFQNHGILVEVDVFQAELKGLVLIDFEFNPKTDIKKFSPPEFCLANVTQERTILGGQLAGKSYEDLETWLEKYNYKKIV